MSIGGGWRVVILSNSPGLASLTAATVQRLRHKPVAVVAARRKETPPGVVSVDEHTEIPDTQVIVAPDKDALAEIVQSVAPDVAVSWAFPWRIPDPALAAPSLGAINFHPSLLPRHRGPNPLAWTVRAGDADFGLTWHRMVADFDSGPILAQRSTPVLIEDTDTEVGPRVGSLGLRMLSRVFERLAAGDLGEPQPVEGVTDAPRFGDDYATIDWSMPARAVHDQVRAWTFTAGTNSVPGPFGEVGGRRVRVLRTTLSRPDREGVRIDCADGPLWVLETEPAD
jgi:methionyl-tRNA formyltransferase